MAATKLPKKRLVKLTLSQVLDLLDQDEFPDKACSVAIIPQTETDAVLSDCDSDGSDMDYEGGTGHLPARLLNAYAEVKQTEDDWNDDLPFTTPPSPPQPPSPITCSSTPTSHHNNEGQPEAPRASSLHRGQPEDSRASTHQRVQPGQPEEPRKLQVVKNKVRVFKRSKRPSTAVSPEHTVYPPNAAECVKQSCPNPMDIFLLMYPHTLREITVEMSNLYSTQTKGKQLNLSMDELLTFYGILITSGYNSVPRRHMYWSVDNDVHSKTISDAMRRNRFDEILASVHVVDNTKITDDPFFKVRPIFSELNQSYKVMPFQEWLSVDESMIPYYGRHGCKQFIKGKPIRFGYKVWSLVSSSGYMYHMEPHCGSHTLLPETGSGQGPSVIIGLAEQAQVPQGCKFIHGSVDLHDLQVSRYHISIRSKKWWWPIFAWSLNSALVNGHLFYRDVVGGTIDLLTFSRIVSQSLLQKFGTKPLSHGRSLLNATVEDQARYDKASHWPINTMHRFQRCRRCDKRTTYACEKCKVPLHIECFKMYHGV